MNASFKATVRKHMMLGAAACVMVGASMVGCATTSADYNPDALGVGQLGRVTDICQSVMGLSPSEGLESGYWLGNDRLEHWTSHYRGCVLSLSDSLLKATDTEVVQQAHDACVAKGLQTGSPDLAMCVLQTVNESPQPSATRVSTMAAAPLSGKIKPVGDFFRASNHETVRREQMACAALGFDPSQDAFKSCVKSLDSTFYAIDNPIN